MKLRTYGQIAVACIALTSCSVMPAGLLSPMQEEPTDTEESYLERGGGPQSRVELGAGEEHLLTRFQTVLEEKEKLEKEHKGLQAELELLRTTLDTERTGREREARAGAYGHAAGLSSSWIRCRGLGACSTTSSSAAGLLPGARVRVVSTGWRGADGLASWRRASICVAHRGCDADQPRASAISRDVPHL